MVRWCWRAYGFGFYLGGWLIKKPDSLLYKRRYLELAQNFYTKHGGKAVMLARVIPIVRTFAPIVAGMVKMSHKRFVLFTIIGGFLWANLFGFGGYYLGVRFPFVLEWLLPIAALIVILSIIPAIISYCKQTYANKVKA